MIAELEADAKENELGLREFGEVGAAEERGEKEKVEVQKAAGGEWKRKKGIERDGKRD